MCQHTPQTIGAYIGKYLPDAGVFARAEGNMKNGKSNKSNKGKKSATAQTRNDTKTLRTAPKQVVGVPRLVSRGSSVTVHNNEIAISVTATATTGAIPAGGAICIMQFAADSTANYLNNTKWINKIAAAYDKWILKSLKLHFVPALPFTASGMYSLFFDSDPTRTTAPSGVVATSGDMAAVSKQIYAEATYHAQRNQLNRVPQYETFPTGTGNTPAAVVGSINIAWDPILLAASSTGAASIGNVWMEYVIEFLNPSAAIA